MGDHDIMCTTVHCTVCKLQYDYENVEADSYEGLFGQLLTKFWEFSAYQSVDDIISPI